MLSAEEWLAKLVSVSRPSVGRIQRFDLLVGGQCLGSTRDLDAALDVEQKLKDAMAPFIRKIQADAMGAVVAADR